MRPNPDLAGTLFPIRPGRSPSGTWVNGSVIEQAVPAEAPRVMVRTIGITRGIVSGRVLALL